MRGRFIETTTDPNGMLQLELPVGRFELVAFNPFHGIQEIDSEISYAGQVVDLDVLFEDASIVRGQVVDVDGLTPLPNARVQLLTQHLLPQTQFTDSAGNFQFELVPKALLRRARRASRETRASERIIARNANAAAAVPPCVNAFCLPTGAPLPGAPPCQWQRPLGAENCRQARPCPRFADS